MKNIKTSLALLKLEMIITKVTLSITIMVPFFNSIGMNQWMIGISQSLFTIALLVLNIPTGWFADKVSRKWSNFIGDAFSAVFFVFYSFANGFEYVVVAEILLGVSMSFSNGADSGLLRAYCKKIDGSGQEFKRQSMIIGCIWPIVAAIGVLIGGFVGAIDYRLAIRLSALPYAIGAIASLFMNEEGERLESRHKNPIKDILHFSRKAMTHSPILRWKMFAQVIGNKITHVMIWALTPLMMVAGVPLYIIGIGWALNSVSTAIGARLAGKFGKKMTVRQLFLVPCLGVVLALVIMSIHLSIFTIWLYGFLGLAQGWVSVTLMPEVQASAPDDMQAVTVSVTQSLGQILYAILLPIVSFVGNIDIRLTMVATIIMFSPMVALVASRLRKYE